MHPLLFIETPKADAPVREQDGFMMIMTNAFNAFIDKRTKLLGLEDTVAKGPVEESDAEWTCATDWEPASPVEYLAPAPKMRRASDSKPSDSDVPRQVGKPGRVPTAML